jgi:HD-GYP domain-containing protein (c-di-GMP phosphodiesterase class II)
MSRPMYWWMLISAQMFCIGLGLWLQQRYLRAELDATVREGSPAVPGFQSERPEGPAGTLPNALGIGVITFFWSAGLSGVAMHLILSWMSEELSRRRAVPEQDALRRSTDLLRTRDAVIFGLAKLADSRDAGTGDHLERISLYSSALAAALRRKEQYREVITPAFVKNIEISAALHDIGKVGIEDAVLLKPGALTPEERRRMEAHTKIGGDCLREIERRLGISNFLSMAREIAASHHERWDGAGYPAGLKGTEISLAARIVAVADVYDALSTKRPYKDALPHKQCVEYIRNEAGRHFDPDLVEVFVDIEATFRAIAEQFLNRGPSLPDKILGDSDRSLKLVEELSAEVETAGT